MNVCVPRTLAGRVQHHLGVLTNGLPLQRLAARTGPCCRFPVTETELVEQPFDLAVDLLHRVASLAWPNRRSIIASQINCMGEPLLIALFVKKSLQSSQLPDKRRLLLVDIVRVIVARGLTVSGLGVHGTTPAATRETRLPKFAAPRRATRANTSSRGPKAIARPP